MQIVSVGIKKNCKTFHEQKLVMSFTSFKAFKYFKSFIIIQFQSFFSPFLSAVSDSHDAPPPTAHQLLIQLRIGFEYVALAIYILCFDYNDPRRCMIHALISDSLCLCF